MYLVEVSSACCWALFLVKRIYVSIFVLVSNTLFTLFRWQNVNLMSINIPLDFVLLRSWKKGYLECRLLRPTYDVFSDW